jgi:hypothetical protein
MIKIKKIKLTKLNYSPFIELIYENGDSFTTILKMENKNSTNKKLVNKLKKCLEENLDLIIK